MSTITPNKSLTEPAHNDSNWDVTLNADFSLIDAAFGATQTINTTGLGATVTFVSTYPAGGPPFSYVPASIILTNTPSNNIRFVIPSGVGGGWTVYNSTSATPYTMTFASGGGGTSVVVPQGEILQIWSDGTNIRPSYNVPSVVPPFTPANLAFGTWTTVASLTTIDLGAQTSRNIIISGSANISSLGSTATTDNIPFSIIFSGTPTLVNSASLIVPGNANITLSAGSSATVSQTASGIWQFTEISRSDGLPIVSPTQSTIGLASANHLRIFNNSVTPNTKFDITADFIALANSSNALVVFSNMAVTVDLTTTGAGGMDTGSRPTNSIFWIWGISNGTAISAIASLSSTAPTLPSGYVYKIRLGAARTDASQNLFRFLQAGNRNEYVLTSGTNTTNYFAITSSGSVSSYVPTTASQVIGITNGNSGSEFGPNNLSYQAQTVYNAGNFQTIQATFLLQNNSIAVINGVLIVGWIDSVNAN